MVPAVAIWALPRAIAEAIAPEEIRRVKFIWRERPVVVELFITLTQVGTAKSGYSEWGIRVIYRGKQLLC
ncbi:MAG: hypothetical protein Fur0025_07060 [Oscillatoriaceae cyanobacterium]